MNKQDLLVVNAFHHPEVPRRSGKVKNLEKFDPGAFGVHGKLADVMDPVKRIALEKSAECIMDAGYSPEAMVGTKTGVYMGSSIAEAELSGLFKKLDDGELRMVGCVGWMIEGYVEVNWVWVLDVADRSTVTS